LAVELKKTVLRLVTGGTDNHLMLVDLTSTGLSGLDVQNALEEANIIANKNAIPFDKKSRQVTSGIRFGTPAVSSRGFGVKEMKVVADMISRIIAHIGDVNVKNQVKEEVISLCQKFPAPGLD
jgi:glycine hydroxymethyltransferase